MFKFFRRKPQDQTNVSPNPLPVDPTPVDPTPVVPTSTPPEMTAEKPTSWFGRLRNSLSRTRAHFSEGLANLFLGKKVIDAELLSEIETQLLSADVGAKTTQVIIERLQEGISRKALKDPQAVFSALQQILIDILKPCEQLMEVGNQQPFVILMVGVNGAGKTTTIGKLALYFRDAGLSIQLAAGDTFRAAAMEQLQVWGERNQVPVIAQHQNADSASVIFDALQSCQAKKTDVLIADTAGRLHTRENLMEELKKIIRVMKKIDSNAPHETLLVLDASLGQNSLIQAQKFHEALQITGIVLTKLDGTAKGGIIFAIADQLKLPIRFIGVGETKEDLRPFEAKAFVQALFE